MECSRKTSNQIFLNDSIGSRSFIYKSTCFAALSIEEPITQVNNIIKNILVWNATCVVGFRNHFSQNMNVNIKIQSCCSSAPTGTTRLTNMISTQIIVYYSTNGTL